MTLSGPVSALALLLIAAADSGAQSFEAATVKINHDGPLAANGFFPTPGRLRVANSTLEQMIHAAFHINASGLAGVLGWMQSERYDIEAKAEGAARFEEELVMLRALLVERFQLQYHTEVRQLTTLALVFADKEHRKFQASKDQGGGAKERITIRPTEISGVNIPIGHFVSVLAAQLNRSVTNETGLSGNFDLSLKYVREDAPGGEEGPSLYAALEEQLGLKLESRKGPVEVMVIDSARKPEAP